MLCGTDVRRLTIESGISGPRDVPSPQSDSRLVSSRFSLASPPFSSVFPAHFLSDRCPSSNETHQITHLIVRLSNMHPPAQAAPLGSIRELIVGLEELFLCLDGFPYVFFSLCPLDSALLSPFHGLHFHPRCFDQTIPHPRPRPLSITHSCKFEIAALVLISFTFDRSNSHVGYPPAF